MVKERPGLVWASEDWAFLLAQTASGTASGPMPYQHRPVPMLLHARLQGPPFKQSSPVRKLENLSVLPVASGDA